MKKIKPSDLRIGNWIRERGRQYEFTVSSGTFSYMEIHKDFFEPIPLTEQWLERLGFENEKIGGLIFTDYKMMDSSLEVLMVLGNTGKWQIAFEKHNLQVYIKYVHELQNLYSALTGKELKTSATVAPKK